TLANASYGIPIGILLGATADYLLSGHIRIGLATLLFPCIFFFILGGHAVLQSYIARILLKFKGRAPLDFHTFIQEGCEKKIFYRVGGGIMFSHRSLMIYFAELKKIPPADH